MADDHVQNQDILDLEGRVREVHVSACRPFNFDSTRISPLEIARRDNNEFFIEKIIYLTRTKHLADQRPSLERSVYSSQYGG